MAARRGAEQRGRPPEASRRRRGVAFAAGLLAAMAAGALAADANDVPADARRGVPAMTADDPAHGLVAALEVQRDGRTVALPTDRRYLRLHAGDRDLRVRLHPAAGTAGRYRFRVVGIDDGWSETGWPAEHRVDALPPGPQTLQVAVATAAGWGPTEERVLLVASPWWQTRGVLAAGGGAALALIGWAVLVERGRRRRRIAWAVAQASRELAERHSEAKTRFLATLGHEIRTPLTGVLGMAELLQDSALDTRQRAQVDAIQGAGRHLLRLVNDALDLARIEAGRLPLQSAPFALRPLLDEVAALLRPLADAKSLGLVLTCADDAPAALQGDATRVRQILFNLGHNAIKFCDRGVVVVEAAALAPQGVRLRVRDDGPGFDADGCERLFRRFETGDDGRGDSGGAGLGLAICRELAVAMGGAIDVRTSPGQGACFRVDLPLPAAEPPAVPVPGVRPALGTWRVLLVEDDPLVAEVVAGLLRRDGHGVVHVGHGLAALAELELAAFDVAILDLDLPGIDGIALAGLIRARGPLPLVALTARADPAAEPAARAAGMAAFLRKPVAGDELARTIEAAIAADAASRRPPVAAL